ncbi:hypothetical protein [Synechococcus sp. PCC 7336]|uniref:hypothetical protein n=1 Tax=Synechococcus sp. PCC 7336 TaxID=195250 RepID=UPI0004762F85|nr:hypothetical protein [Synechococcus sp. PCC 7336]
MSGLLERMQQYLQNPVQFDPLPSDYQSWSAQKKQEFLWQERILPSQYSSLPPLEKIDIPGLFFTALSKKMDLQADEAPKNWKKAIHAHGAVAKVKFVAASGNPFTGVFSGADYGLIRLSVTRDPSDRPFAPGLALKLFVDRKHSENFSALVSLTGQGDNHNILANEFSTIVPVVNEIGPRLINLIFRRVTRYPTKLYVRDLAEVDRFGQTVAQPIYPRELFLVPNPAIAFPKESGRDFRNDLATLAPDTLLFTVHAVDPREVGDSEGNSDEYRNKAKPIGELLSTSKFVSSFYGDYRLFFRHQRFKDE